MRTVKECLTVAEPYQPKPVTPERLAKIEREFLYLLNTNLIQDLVAHIRGLEERLARHVDGENS